MALLKSVSKYGAEFASAYHRITNLDYYINEYSYTQFVEQEPDADGNPVPPVEETVEVVEKRCNITIKTYIDEAARVAKSEPIISKVFNFEPDWTASENVLEQAYAFLKTQDEYADAVDA